MDTTKLVADVKARFKHQENKIYLKEKYTAKLQFAHQGGMWTANPALISFLNSVINNSPTTVLQDNFENPIHVDVHSLLDEAVKRYNGAMQEWHSEYKELAKNR